MTVTLYHNPKCSTSRAVLALIRAAGIEPDIVAYLETALDRTAIAALLKRLDMPARDLIRSKESLYRELGLDDPALSEEKLIDAMAAHPILIERPVVVSPRGARLCRPPETVQDLLR